jgi:NAD(P)H-hydrate epimerase
MINDLRSLSRAEVRRLDLQATEELALPTLVLMENAGRGAAAWLAELVGAIPPSSEGRPLFVRPLVEASQVLRKTGLATIVILCGPGNNGGDGGVVARHLDAWGFPVRVIWFAHCEQLRGDAALQWSILAKSGIRQTSWFEAHSVDGDFDRAALSAILGDADWLVDGLLGTGLSRPVEGPLRTVIELMNNCGKPILALDVPSGLDVDTGHALGIAVRARATATFVATKLGFTAAAAAYTGEVAVIDIGLPGCLLAPFRVL